MATRTFTARPSWKNTVLTALVASSMLALTAWVSLGAFDRPVRDGTAEAAATEVAEAQPSP